MFNGLKRTINHEVVGFFVFIKSMSLKGSCKMHNLKRLHNNLNGLIFLLPIDEGEGVRC